MLSQLESLCEKSGVNVEFISNKFIDDVSELKYSKPVIKVHKIFRECPMRVAAAVIDVFTEEGNTSECMDIIESYLKEKFGPVGIMVQAPRAVIRKTVNNVLSQPHNEKEENHFSYEDKYIEAEIFSIDVTSLKGNHENFNASDTLTLKEQDILELDIVVSPSLHK